jgi:methylated-DNA-protein-cysteine methyltransferase-like protein
MDELDSRVLVVVAQIPEGRAASYGDVAALAGTTTPREVGQALLRHGEDVPWWRVVRADGTPAPHLRAGQLEHLRNEGVPLTPDGEAVDFRRARWDKARPDDGDDGQQLSLLD